MNFDALPVFLRQILDLNQNNTSFHQQHGHLFFTEAKIARLQRHGLLADDSGIVGGIEYLQQAKQSHTNPYADQAARLALFEAQDAAARKDIGVGAIIIHKSGFLIAANGNRGYTSEDRSFHAEMGMLRQLDQIQRRWGIQIPFEDLFMVSTLEPCCQCTHGCMHLQVGNTFYVKEDASGGMASWKSSFGETLKESADRMFSRLAVSKDIQRGVHTVYANSLDPFHAACDNRVDSRHYSRDWREGYTLFVQGNRKLGKTEETLLTVSDFNDEVKLLIKMAHIAEEDGFPPDAAALVDDRGHVVVVAFDLRQSKYGDFSSSPAILLAEAYNELTSNRPEKQVAIPRPSHLRVIMLHEPNLMEMQRLMPFSAIDYILDHDQGFARKKPYLPPHYRDGACYCGKYEIHPEDIGHSYLQRLRKIPPPIGIPVGEEGRLLT